jgi:ribosomal protein S18 acetylase RimI-like enzyme
MIDTEPLQYRSARAEDLATVVDLIIDDPLGAGREATDGDLSPYAAALARIEADPSNDFIVVERGGEIVGCLQLTLIPGLSRNGITRAQIESVRIAASERGRGLGKQVFEWAIAESKARGAGMVQLTTDNERANAHRFYQRLGFKATHVGMKLALT